MLFTVDIMYLLQSATNSMPQPYISSVMCSFSWLQAKNCKHVLEKKWLMCFSVSIYACVFALELWNLPVIEADSTISDLIIGEVEDSDWSPGFTPSDFSKSGTSLVLFPKDTRWCFHVLYLLPHIVSSNSSLTPRSIIPTHPYPYLSLWYVGEVVGKSCIWSIQIRGFPGSHSICCYLCSRVVKGGEEFSPCLAISF